MKEKPVNNVLQDASARIRNSVDEYKAWVFSLADFMDEIGHRLAAANAAFKLIADNIGTEFEFPNFDEDEPRFFCTVSFYPKEGDPTKKILKIVITPDEENKDD